MYVKTFLRNLLKDKTYSLLNIAGLAMGLTASIAQEIPGIKRTARMADFGALTFTLEDKALGEQGDYADADIFPMLNLPFLSGGLPGKSTR